MSTHCLLTALVAAALGLGMSAAAEPADDAAVLKTQAVAWDDAIVHKRRAAVEANMAPEFLHIGENGALSDRTAFLDSILS